MRTSTDLLIERLFSDDTVKAVAFMLVILTVCYLAIQSRVVPDDLKAVVFSVVGYYFGASRSTSHRKTDGLVGMAVGLLAIGLTH